MTNPTSDSARLRKNEAERTRRASKRPVGLLTAADAAKGRAKAWRSNNHTGKHDGYVKIGRTFETEPQRCECGSKWFDAEQLCLKCGKWA